MYGYDRALAAAKETGTQIIQDISDADSKFKLGNISIKLFNYKNEYDEDGNLKKVYDDNLNSILSLLTINNTKIFLGGDLENTDIGKEDLYAPLIGKVARPKAFLACQVSTIGRGKTVSRTNRRGGRPATR